MLSKKRCARLISPLAAGLLGLTLVSACGSGAEPEDQLVVARQTEALSSSLNYPTRWTLVNSSGQSLGFSCTCPKPRGLKNPINMTPTTVSAGASTVFQWGAGWYNDGLGLNACTWTCSTRAGARVTATVTFNTDWGENITLRARSGGTLVIER